MTQTTLTLHKKQEKKEKPPKRIGYCFFCGKEIVAGDQTVYTFESGELTHVDCIPKTCIEGFKGHLNEELVAWEMVQRGYEVYFPVCPNSRVDILGEKKGRYLRVQVRTAHLQGRSYHLGLGVGADKERWRDKNQDVDVLVIVCPPSAFQQGLHFFVVPAKVVRDHWSMTFAPDSDAKYGEYLDNWNILDNVATDLIFVPYEADSHLMKTEMHPGWIEALKQNQQYITGITKGEDSELIVRNIVRGFPVPFLPETADLFVQYCIQRLNVEVLHELIHQVDPKLRCLFHDETEDKVKMLVRMLLAG